jgi:hypothetical protein
VKHNLENTGGHRLLRTRAQRETDRPKPPSDAPDLRETTARMQAASPRDGVMSYRVAIVADGGTVQLLVLRPGEAAADGLPTAFIVPTDQASSEAIAALLTRGGKT